MRDYFHPLRDVWRNDIFATVKIMPTYVLTRNIEALKDFLHEHPGRLKHLRDADRYLDCFNFWKAELITRGVKVPALNEPRVID